jgi:hypothetical protein
MAQWASSNWSNADEYECSGTPFLTGTHGAIDLTQTVQRITFPRVTRWIQVWNHTTTVAHAMKVGFTANGVKGTVGHVSGSTSTAGEAHFMYIPGDTQGMNTTGRLELRCTEIFVAATTSSRVNFTVVAGLTNIPPRNMFNMTGSIDGTPQILGVG